MHLQTDIRLQKVSKFGNNLFCRRPEFDAAALQNRNHLPSLDSLRWRVDVAISTRWVKLTRRISSCFGFLSKIMASTKESFVLLNDNVTEGWHLPPALLFIWLRLFRTIALLAQANKALKWSHSHLFCLDTGSIPGRSTFFPAKFFFRLKYLLKELFCWSCLK